MSLFGATTHVSPAFQISALRNVLQFIGGNKLKFVASSVKIAGKEDRARWV
jgi:hypothetical protein